MHVGEYSETACKFMNISTTNNGGAYHYFRREVLVFPVEQTIHLDVFNYITAFASKSYLNHQHQQRNGRSFVILQAVFSISFDISTTDIFGFYSSISGTEFFVSLNRFTLLEQMA
mgnify:CR=1 FL=1